MARKVTPMPQIARSPEPESFAPLPLPDSPRVVALGAAPAERGGSPARALHEQLVDTFAPAPAATDRLPPRTRLFVIVGAVAAPWAAIALGYGLFG